MRQLNKRNPQAQANPQMQMMQRYMPLIFAVIYINIAAGVNIYFIVSSLCRIGIQEAIFRSGALDKVRAAPAAEGVLPSGRGGTAKAPGRRSFMERLADMQKQALEQKEAQQRAKQGLPPAELPGPSSNGAPKNGPKPPGRTGSTGPAKAGGSPKAGGTAKSNGYPGAGPNGKSTNGAPTNGDDKKTTHPRSKTKRERKDR